MKDDSQLIESALAGDSSAFCELVRKYQARLYNTLLHLTGDPNEAEDVGQDAFAQAFVKLETFQGKSAFYTWLYRIAFNQWVSRRRRKKVVVSIDQNRDATGDEPVDRHEGPTENLEREERIKQVQCALQTLSDDHRSVLVLREMDGCDYDTIAEMLKLPVGTVRSRLHRARLQLRERLEAMLHQQLAE